MERFLCTGTRLSILYELVLSLGLPWWLRGLLLWLSWCRICLQGRRTGFDPWVGKIPWRRERLPTLVLWPGEFHGLYSLSSVHCIVYRVTKSWAWLSDFLLTGGPAVRICLHEAKEMWVQFLDQKDPLEEGMATHSSNLTWRIPGTEESGGLQSIASQRVRYD